jgi:hypothetical protein
MNAELLRNAWIELAPRRVILMVTILALAFFAAALPGGIEYGPSTVAVVLYYVIVVVWGTRNAATSVVGEIRDRTWDSQRLSSIGAGAMTIGKLFGSTLYNWLGGAICLAVILAGTAVHNGLVTAVLDAVYFVSIGLISQAVSLLASLIAVGRRQPHSRLELFGYQLAGLAAAILVYRIWSTADPVSAIVAHAPIVSNIQWWSHAIDARLFLLVSLAIFSAWTFLACYREMRMELMIRNGPFVWLLFLAFTGIYVAGFDSWLPSNGPMIGWDAISLRLALALGTYLILTYTMVLFEPKDRVQFRWLAGQFSAGHVARAFLSLQCWMMSYGAAVLTSAVLVTWLSHRGGPLSQQAIIIATIGFLTRDVCIFVLSQKLAGSRRGDYAAVAALLALYGLLPAIVSGLHMTSALIVFYPRPSDPAWLVPAVAWSEAFLVLALTLGTGKLRAVRPVPV